MDEREQRIGENEILYRTVNEKIEDLNTAFGTLTESMTVVCECGDANCTAQIELDIPTYERVRADAALFVVRPGHMFPEVEDVVEHGNGFEIVRKNAGEARDLAEEHDPRDRA
jgi:hypothetical protein